MNADQELKALISQRGHLKAALTRFQSFKANFKETDRVWDLRVRKNELNSIRDKFEEKQSRIEEIICDEKQCEERATFENTYFELLAWAEETLERRSQIVQNQTVGTASLHSNSIDHVTQVKLPLVNLPSFDGKYEKWVTFYETFCSLIDQDERLTNIQKFHYLRSCLKDAAAKAIESVSIASDNYHTALDILKTRFANKKLTIKTHVSAIFDLPTISKTCLVSLRSLVDEATAHVKALSNLNLRTDHWDVLLIHIVTSKLDYVTNREWEASLKSDDYLPTFDELLKFLNSRCRLIEALNFEKGTTRVTEPRENKFKHIKSNTNRVHLATSQGANCSFCRQTHFSSQCKDLLRLSVEARLKECKQRNLCVNCLKRNHTTSNCPSLNSCKICKRRHHTLLHLPDTTQINDNTNIGRSEALAQPSTSSVVNYCNSYTSATVSLLSTAIVQILDKHNNRINVRALLDPGSETSFITKSMCDKLDLPVHATNHTIFGITLDSTYINKAVNVKIHSRYNAFSANLKCLILPRITSDYPSITLKASVIKIPSNIQLADPEFYLTKPIDLLIGAELFWELLAIGQVKTDDTQPLFQKTVLGWVAGGKVLYPPGRKTSVSNLTLTNVEHVQKFMTKFWEIEDCSKVNCNKPSLEDTATEEHFQKYHKRTADGRFVVKLPFKLEKIPNLSSKSVALKRFEHLESNFRKNSLLKQTYCAFMKEYLDLQHMSQVETPTAAGCYYMPHHAICRNESLTTKTRVVFDASAKGENGASLNDYLSVGPNIQNDIFSIIIRFRMYEFVFTADIVKMYRQILVDPEHRKYQRIFWRQDSNNPINVYELNTVTYGTASAPFLALRCLKQLAIENIKEHPRACKVILNDFYVDDLLTGADNLFQLIQIRDQIINILNLGKFTLNKWASNSRSLLPDEQDSSVIMNLDKQGYSKTLGLQWNSSSDTINYLVNPPSNPLKVTKRTILSCIAQLYDPLGLVSPVIVIAKIIMQELWTLKLDWDESVPINIHTRWIEFRQQLTKLHEISVPRNVTISSKQPSVELHGFCDASEKAYGACVYIKSISRSKTEAQLNLLCAKTRVAPLKPITIPRLELCAAVLLANLVNQVNLSTNFDIKGYHYWSDSTITLAWLASPANRWNTFVRNRVAEVQSLTNVEDWKHIDSEQSPADLLSRGVLPIKLCNSKLWWHAPEWLLQNSNHWPKSRAHLASSDVPEAKTVALTVTNSYNLPIFKRFSKFTTLQRVVAYVLRFIQNCQNLKKLEGALSASELRHATMIIVRYAQNQVFSNEINCLRNGKPLEKKSSIISLNPFLDINSILRVGGRLRNANVEYDKKFQIILPKTHTITTLIIRHEHMRLLHGGIQTTLNSLRQQFWPLSGKNSVRGIIRKCVICFRAKPISRQHIMGDLPANRVQQARPFLNSGVDFAGPILIKDGRGRGRKTVKAYVALFICLSTKAVHLELVGDLTAEAFLNALKRFLARRGNVVNLYSDNATNFVGATRELENLHFLVKNNTIHRDIANELAKCNITWHFIPPRSPHFGGIWESGIKSAKYHIRRVIGETILTYEEMYTFLTRIEACLNSRPLTPISSDHNDLIPLTPAHFLIGDLLTAPAEPDLASIKPTTLSRWQHVERMRQHFWDRWHQEYIHTLQQRTKWKFTDPSYSAEIGALVIVKEDNRPPLQWKLGRIVATHPGKDKVTRVVSIKTTSGVIKRAMSRVCVLPVLHDNEN